MVGSNWDTLRLSGNGDVREGGADCHDIEIVLVRDGSNQRPSVGILHCYKLLYSCDVPSSCSMSGEGIVVYGKWQKCSTAYTSKSTEINMYDQMIHYEEEHSTVSAGMDSWYYAM